MIPGVSLDMDSEMTRKRLMMSSSHLTLSVYGPWSLHRKWLETHMACSSPLNVNRPGGNSEKVMIVQSHKDHLGIGSWLTGAISHLLDRQKKFGDNNHE